MPVSTTPSRTPTTVTRPASATPSSANGAAQSPGSVEHTVKRGENLTSIARDHNTSIDAILGANPRIQDPDALNVGQVLKIPQPAAPAAVAPAGVAPEAAPQPSTGSTATGPRPLAANGGIAPQALSAESAALPTLVKGSRGNAVEDAQRRLQAQGLYQGKLDGIFGPKTQSAVKQFQAQQGIKVDGKIGPETWGRLTPTGSAPTSTGTTPASGAGGSTPTSPGNATTDGPSSTADGPTSTTTGAVTKGGAPSLNIPFTPNAAALEKAKTSAVGRRVAELTEKNRATYEQASKLTGVPAEMIAAIHVNESAQGTYRRSTHGPESGYGLDDRYVTTSWGNQQLARYGLGSWERGTNSEKSQLQSAVIAAEHLKRQARTAGITIDQNMTTGEIAGAVTSYMAGGGAGKKANQRGSSWMLNTTDANPHPLHPGGTSRGPGGTTIRVAASRKPGLLRWDTLLPLLQDQLKAR